MPFANIAVIDDLDKTSAPEIHGVPTPLNDVVDCYRSLPRYVPMPSGSETEKFSGLKRSKIYQLILPCKENGFRPPVKSISLKPPGALKGKRLVVLASLLEFLAKLEAEQLSEAVTKADRHP
jgi:hypothetical protein